MTSNDFIRESNSWNIRRGKLIEMFTVEQFARVLCQKNSTKLCRLVLNLKKKKNNTSLDEEQQILQL